MEISVVFVTAQISDKSKQFPPSPLQTLFLATTTHMTCDQSSLLCRKRSQIRSGQCGDVGEAVCALGAIVKKELTAWMGTHLIGKSIDKSNLKCYGRRLRMRFVMMMMMIWTDQIHALIQLNISFQTKGSAIVTALCVLWSQSNFLIYYHISLRPGVKKPEINHNFDLCYVFSIC